MIEIYADPTKTRNCHIIEVDVGRGAVHALDRERALPKNPKTGKIVALSMNIATLRKLTTPLRVGT